MVSLSGLLDSVVISEEVDSTSYVGSRWYFKMEYDNLKRVSQIRTNYGLYGIWIKKYFYGGDSKYPYHRYDTSIIPPSANTVMANYTYYHYNQNNQRILDSNVNYQYPYGGPLSAIVRSGPNTYTYHHGFYVYHSKWGRDTFFVENSEVVARKTVGTSSITVLSYTRLNGFHPVKNPFHHENLKALGVHDGMHFGGDFYMFFPLNHDLSQNEFLPKQMTGHGSTMWAYQQGERPVINFYYELDPKGLVNKVLVSRYFYKLNGTFIAKDYRTFTFYYHP